MPRFKGFRYPSEVIAYAVCAYHRFALSTADVENLLAERGIIVSRETVRKWVNRFGSDFTGFLPQAHPDRDDEWHLDAAESTIRGEDIWLWRAFDSSGEMIDFFVQKQKNATEAKQFFERLRDQSGSGRTGTPSP